MKCTKCGAIPSRPGAIFCEACGTPFVQEGLGAMASTSGGCSHCGAPEDSFDSMGFCSQCGLERVKIKSPAHWELAISPKMAGVCDLGLLRAENEDSMALGEAAGVRIAVLCDGISQSQDAAEAASLAAKVVSKFLLEAAEKTPEIALEVSLKAALAAAHKEVSNLAGHLPPGSYDAPSTTIMVACIRGNEVVLGWLGDCRAYWFGSEARLLTKDHSWINEVVDAGQLTFQEAQTRRGANAVTRSLGGPSFSSGEIDEPSISSITLPGSGWLLLCSDGLWGYASEPAQMAAWLTEASASRSEALPIAQALIEKAKESGGKDNLTALLIGLPA